MKENEKKEQGNGKFSVLMSVYKNDEPEFLKLALESIYEKQTLKPDEIVIVFDGPLSDSLYAVIEEFCTDKTDIVNILKLKKNSGLGNALRVGSGYCKNEYILRMDSDDISDPQRFKKQMAYARIYPELDVIGTNIAEFNKSINENMRVREVPASHDNIVKMGEKRNPMNHVSVCMKKSALERCGGYETLPLLEDYYLWLKMIATGCKLGNIQESLVYVRVGNGFDSKRGSKDRIKGWKVLQEYMLTHGMIDKKEALMNMIYIRSFVNTPAVVKKLLYSKILRK